MLLANFQATKPGNSWLNQVKWHLSSWEPAPTIMDTYLLVYILYVVCIYESAWIKHTHKKSNGKCLLVFAAWWMCPWWVLCNWLIDDIILLTLNLIKRRSLLAGSGSRTCRLAPVTAYGPRLGLRSPGPRLPIDLSGRRRGAGRVLPLRRRHFACRRPTKGHKRRNVWHILMVATYQLEYYGDCIQYFLVK